MSPNDDYKWGSIWDIMRARVGAILESHKDESLVYAGLYYVHKARSYVYDELKENIHTVLDVLGCVPGVGCFADGANAVLYATEGDYKNAALSAACAVSGALCLGSSAIAKAATKGVKIASKLAKVAKGAETVGKVLEIGTNVVSAGINIVETARNIQKNGAVSGWDVFNIVGSAVGIWLNVKAGRKWLNDASASNIPKARGTMGKVEDVAVGVGKSGYGKLSGNSGKPKGWKVGDPIDNLTKVGNEPSWSTVKSRYWKNEAYYNSDFYTERNLNFMRKGNAPHYSESIDVPKELHHINGRNIENPHSQSNLIEVWPWEHDDIDPYRHYTGPRP